MSRPISLERLDHLFTLGSFGRKQVFWRHDVDFSLSAALKMAQFEEERSISATYYLFFDKSCPTYTVAQAEICSLQLRKLGHTVGQHFDERIWNERPLFLPRHKQISFHCPTEKVLWKEIYGFQSAYEPKWRNKYFADSDGVFRYGDPEDFLMKSARRVQINLHPEWWFEPNTWKKLSDEEFKSFLHRPKAGYPERD